MSNDAEVIHVNAGEGDAFSAVGDVYRVLASGNQTGRVYALSEIRVSPDAGANTVVVKQGEAGIHNSHTNGRVRTKSRPTQERRWICRGIDQTGVAPRLIRLVTGKSKPKVFRECAVALPAN
jgi:hypothetical protein